MKSRIAPFLNCRTGTGASWGYSFHLRIIDVSRYHGRLGGMKQHCKAKDIKAWYIAACSSSYSTRSLAFTAVEFRVFASSIMSFKAILTIIALAVAVSAVPAHTVPCGKGRTASNAVVSAVHSNVPSPLLTTIISPVLQVVRGPGRHQWSRRPVSLNTLRLHQSRTHLLSERFDGAECGEETHEVRTLALRV